MLRNVCVIKLQCKPDTTFEIFKGFGCQIVKFAIEQLFYTNLITLLKPSNRPQHLRLNIDGVNKCHLTNFITVSLFLSPILYWGHSLWLTRSHYRFLQRTYTNSALICKWAISFLNGGVQGWKKELKRFIAQSFPSFSFRNGRWSYPRQIQC